MTIFSPEPAGNWTASLTEDGLVAATLALAIVHAGLALLVLSRRRSRSSPRRDPVPDAASRRSSARRFEGLMAWFKAFHVVFVVAWFAGLFYLPRLFVYHVDTSDEIGHARFVVLERRLLQIIHLSGALAIAFGIALLVGWAQHAPDYFRQGWLHAKLALVALLIAYQVSLAAFVRRLRERRCTRSVRWFRIYTEVPALFLIAIVVLVVVKPF